MRTIACLRSAGFGLVAVCAAGPALAQSVPFPPGQVVVGPIGNTDGPSLRTLTTGAEANVYVGAIEGGFIPNQPASVVRTSEPTQFVRFFNSNNSDTLGPAVGPWIATSNSVRGLTAAQIKDVLALPDLPNAVTLVKVPAGTCILGGPGNPALGNFPANPPDVPTAGPWGAAGVPQYYIVGRTSAANCTDPQNLASSDYIINLNLGTYALAYTPNALPGNPAAVAAALDHAVFPAPFTAMDSVYNSLDVLNFTDPAQFNSALSQLAGEVNADLVSSSLASGQMFLNLLRQRQRNEAGLPLAGTGPSAAPGTPDGHAWINASGATSTIDGSGGSHDFQQNLVAVAAGLDAKVTAHLKLGAAVGYGRAGFSVSGLESTGNANAYQGAVYGTYALGPAYVDAVVGYMYSDFDISRVIAFTGQQGITSAQTQSQAFLSSVEAGYAFAITPATTFTPTAGLQVIALRQDGFSETGAGALGLSVAGENFTAVTSLLGGDLRHRFDGGAFGIITADLRLAWAHEFGDIDRSASSAFVQLPSASFVVQGAQPTRDAAVVGVGLALKGPATVFVRYDGILGGEQQTHSGTAGLSVTF